MGLRPSTGALVYDVLRVGESSDALTVTVTNTQTIPIEFKGVRLVGAAWRVGALGACGVRGAATSERYAVARGGGGGGGKGSE